MWSLLAVTSRAVHNSEPLLFLTRLLDQPLVSSLFRPSRLRTKCCLAGNMLDLQQWGDLRAAISALDHVPKVGPKIPTDTTTRRPV